MKRTFSASVWQEGPWFVAQCLDVDVASQGRSKDEALANLKEALELYFEKPSTPVPNIEKVEIEIGAA
jgi:predicted RNase H-like HicB family nuclease